MDAWELTEHASPNEPLSVCISLQERQREASSSSLAAINQEQKASTVVDVYDRSMRNWSPYRPPRMRVSGTGAREEYSNERCYGEVGGHTEVILSDDCSSCNR
jgi:hypothetical protein